MYSCSRSNQLISEEWTSFGSWQGRVWFTSLQKPWDLEIFSFHTRITSCSPMKNPCHDLFLWYLCDIFVCWSPAFLRFPQTPHKKWKSGNPKCHGSTMVPWLSCWGWTPLNRWRSGTSTGPSTFGVGEFCHRLPLWPRNIQFTYLDLPRLMFLPVGHKIFFFFRGLRLPDSI